MSLRLSETWFRRALWLIAVLFAIFLINLGGLVVGELPLVPPSPTLDTFIPKDRAADLNKQITQATTQFQTSSDRLAINTLQLNAKRARYDNARASFSNWLATSNATQEGDPASGLVAQTRALDSLKADERVAELAVENSEKEKLVAAQTLAAVNASYEQLTAAAQKQLAAVARKVELKVFAIRLALTLPLLVIAGWLFAKKRKSNYWAFVWGFNGFAVYTFFVELVPYLPYYGGYVRYSVGVVLTLLLGRYLIYALQRYLSTQQAKEQLPEQERHQVLNYELAQKRLMQAICPGCERALAINDVTHDFCMHCGICAFNRCQHCQTRKNAFAHYCHACGALA